mmetsp:Transcript_20970/g.60571  ORF Transcript_20970/g.60571 Transcript_20970/m.60571 type:complete len:263 (-) Transcript_20970:13-801(-)
MGASKASSGPSPAGSAYMGSRVPGTLSHLDVAGALAAPTLCHRWVLSLRGLAPPPTPATKRRRRTSMSWIRSCRNGKRICRASSPCRTSSYRGSRSSWRRSGRCNRSTTCSLTGRLPGETAMGRRNEAFTRRWPPQRSRRIALAATITQRGRRSPRRRAWTFPACRCTSCFRHRRGSDAQRCRTLHESRTHLGGCEGEVVRRRRRACRLAKHRPLEPSQRWRTVRGFRSAIPSPIVKRVQGCTLGAPIRRRFWTGRYMGCVA